VGLAKPWAMHMCAITWIFVFKVKKKKGGGVEWEEVA